MPPEPLDEPVDAAKRVSGLSNGIVVGVGRAPSRQLARVKLDEHGAEEDLHRRLVGAYPDLLAAVERRHRVERARDLDVMIGMHLGLHRSERNFERLGRWREHQGLLRLLEGLARTLRLVPCTRMPATSRDQCSALRWASARSVKVSPSHQLSRTYGT